MIRTLVAASFCFVLASSLFAQVKPGQYANGPFDSKGLDTVNRGSLNLMIAIPIINKPGRGGTNFTYTLAYNGAVWYPITTGSSKTWVNTPNFGWQGQTEVVLGYVTQSVISIPCSPDNSHVTELITNNVIYHDSFGAVHRFTGERINSGGQCGGDSDTLTGSWSIDHAFQHMSSGSLLDRWGRNVNAPTFTNVPAGYALGYYKDNNGNEITVDNSGHFTDTMGRNALTVSGTAPSPVTMAYTDANGVARSAIIDYATYTVQTQFNCNGITDPTITNTPLINAITLGDGTSYQFTYEETPPGVNPVSPGAVTGRLASVTLPGGGTIEYAYPGANNGIVCNDGTGLSLTRTTTTDSGSSVLTYSRVGINPPLGTSTTNVTDGNNNITTISFVEPQNGDPGEYYETGRRAYNGLTIAGTPLLTFQTCYNGTSQSACGATALTLPITQIDTYNLPDNVAESGSTMKFNTFGLMTERDTYDFGSSSARGSLLQAEVWNYPTSGVPGLVSSYQVKDGSGNLIGQDAYSYDTGTLTTTSGLPQHVAISTQRGNPTAIQQYVDASSFIVINNAYDDAGTIRQTSGTLGTTTYTAFDPTDTLATSATLPSTPSGIALSQSASYDSNTGVQTSATDPNGKLTLAQEFDPLNRPKVISYADGGQANLTYSPTEIYQCQVLDSSGSSQTCSFVQYDGYGRLSRAAITSGQSYGEFYQVDYCYDANGRLEFQSQRYESTGFDTTTKRCSGAGSTMTYDGLGRLVKTTYTDGSYSQYTYTGQAAQFRDTTGAMRITQSDGLGRLTAVCEVASAGTIMGGGYCGWLRARHQW